MSESSGTTVDSVQSLLGALQRVEQKEGKLLFFRGHASVIDGPLQPGIYRTSKAIENERTMFTELITRCPADFREAKSTFEKLVKMQHYSLPTRLLDITDNPLVALYFACEAKLKKDESKEDEYEDGELLIFAFDRDKVKYFDSDTISVISNLARMPHNFLIGEATESEASVGEFNKLSEIGSLHNEIQSEKPHFKPIIRREDVESVACVRPKLDNNRVIRQGAAFLAFGISGVKGKCAEIPRTVERCVSGESRLRIPWDKKEEIRRQLALIGVSGDTLFPELENVAVWLRSKYGLLDEEEKSAAEILAKKGVKPQLIPFLYFLHRKGKSE